jgi:opacity protein-like surface antigen
MKNLMILLLLGFPLFLQAQMDSSLTQWNLTLHIGPYLSGVPIHIEKEMQTNGFSKSVGLFSSATTSENMARTNPVISFGIERVSSRAWSQKFLMSLLSGYVWGLSPIYGDLKINYQQVAASFLVGYHSKQRITRIAAGPALHFTSLKTAAYSSSSLQESLTNVGFTVEAGLRFPAKKRVFFDFNMQYQFVGKQDLGTYEFSQGKDIKVGKKSANYFCFNFGLGVRLGKRIKQIKNT